MSTKAGDAEPEILRHHKGPIGVATLNRPRALNALTSNMVEGLHSLLLDWESDPKVSAVLVKGAGGKAFCAGGDVKAVVQLGKAGQVHNALAFFRSEYRLNHLIARLRKPYIALMDGITMGGGAGVSVHGTFRVATERTLFAMPECAIGLIPDIGASYFLSRLPGHIGMYLGLTGARLSGVDVKLSGLATHYIPSALIPELEQSIENLGPDAGDMTKLQTMLNDFQNRTPLPDGQQLPARQAEIDSLFGGKNSVQELHTACREGGEFAQEILAQMNKGSPLSQRIVWEQLPRGSTMRLEDCLHMEYRLVYHLVAKPDSDFYTGVDAVLISKTGNPQWKHRSVEEVAVEEVEGLFEHNPPNEELQLPERGGGQRAARL